MLTDYALAIFSCKREMIRTIGHLERAGFKELFLDGSGLYDRECLRRKDFEAEKGNDFDFAIWGIGSSFPQMEILNHRFKMMDVIEMLKKVESKVEIERGFDLMSVPGLAEIDFKAWIGDRIISQQYKHEDEVITGIEMSPDGQIGYTYSYWIFEDCDSHMDCEGHWRDYYGNYIKDFAFLANSPRPRKTPKTMDIKRDASGKIVSFLIS